MDHLLRDDLEITASAAASSAEAERRADLLDRPARSVDVDLDAERLEERRGSR